MSRTGWTVTASTPPVTDLTNDSLASAIDGNIGTRWTTGQPQMNGQSFNVDLGQATTVSQVLLFLSPGGPADAGDGTDAPISYQLGLSTDNATFSTVASGSGTAPATVMCFTPQTARYIKITQTGMATIAWWSINEIAVIP